MEKYLLRPFTENDLDSLVRHANNFNVAQFLTGRFPHPYTLEDGKSFIQIATQEDPRHIFAIEIGGEVAGSIGIHPKNDIYCKNAELGYWLAEPYWGKGIITAVLKDIISYAFDTFDIVRLYARTFSNNVPSQRVLVKNGFLLEANLHRAIYKNGEFYDELIYSIVRKDK